MAYLRGNSYVDGNLIVEGALQVSRLTTTSGNLPYLKSPHKNNYIVRFEKDDGGLTNSYLWEGGTTFSIDNTATFTAESHTLNLGYYPEQVRVIYQDIYLDEKSMKWKWSERK